MARPGKASILDFLVYSTIVLGKAFVLIAGNALMLLELFNKFAALPTTQAKTWAAGIPSWLHGWPGLILIILAILLDGWLFWHGWIRRRQLSP